MDLNYQCSILNRSVCLYLVAFSANTRIRVDSGRIFGVDLGVFRGQRPTRHALHILRSHRSVILSPVDELEFHIGRVVSDFDLEVDQVVLVPVGAPGFGECCKRDPAKICFDSHKFSNILCSG